MLAVGASAFDVPIRGSVPLLFALGFLFLVGMLGQGLLISVLAKNQLVATQAGVLSSLLPSLLLSGALFPIENMPRPLQALARLVPARYLVHGLRGVLLKGSGLALLGPDLLALALFAAAILALATATFPAEGGMTPARARGRGLALTQYRAVVRKETLQTLRDRRILFMLVAAPLIQTVLFGFAVDFDVDRVPTAVADLDGSGGSRERAAPAPRRRDAPPRRARHERRRGGPAARRRSCLGGGDHAAWLRSGPRRRADRPRAGARRRDEPGAGRRGVERRGPLLWLARPALMDERLAAAGRPRRPRCG